VYGGIVAEGSLADGILTGLGAFGLNVGIAGTTVDIAATFAGDDGKPSAASGPSVRGWWGGQSIMC
jgi:hypothetical protein